MIETLKTKLMTKATKAYHWLESRYGKCWAKVVLAVGILGTFTPIPGIVIAAPFMVLGEAGLALRHLRVA